MNEERTCRVCGSPLSASSKFCSSCGTPVDTDASEIKPEAETDVSRLIDEVETVTVDETTGTGDDEVTLSQAIEESFTDAETQNESPASAKQPPESVDQPETAESPSAPMGPVETPSHDQVTGEAPPPATPQHPTFVPPAYPPPASDGGNKIWWILGGIGVFIIIVCCCIMLSVGILASADSALHDEFDKASYLFSSVV